MNFPSVGELIIVAVMILLLGASLALGAAWCSTGSTFCAAGALICFCLLVALGVIMNWVN